MSTRETRLEAGSELDALVAREVLGWRTHQMDDPREPEWWLCSDGCKAAMHTHYTPPACSTSGDGMLTVLEKMCELGWVGSFQWDEMGYGATFLSERSGGGLFEAPSLPYVVALAALEAVRAGR